MFSKKLILKKTHDFSAVKKPRLTVVFIHGIASDSTTWNHALDYLEGTMSLKEVRFVTFDLLGSGRSSNDQKLEFGYKDQLEALILWMIWKIQNLRRELKHLKIW